MSLSLQHSCHSGQGSGSNVLHHLKLRCAVETSLLDEAGEMSLHQSQDVFENDICSEGILSHTSFLSLLLSEDVETKAC